MFFYKIFKNNFFVKIINYSSFKSLPYVSFFKPFVRFVYKKQALLGLLLLAFIISDLLLIKSYNILLPKKTLDSLRLKPKLASQTHVANFYKNIWENNPFHQEAIPLKLAKDMELQLEPSLSSLPFELVGTIIHANPLRSVASISLSSQSKTLSYSQGDIIDSQADIKKIQRDRVVFLNQNNSRLEYIVIPEKTKNFNLAYLDKKPKLVDNSLIKKSSDNMYKIKRSDVNEQLQNLPHILKQARVVPQRSKDGTMLGWKFMSIKKDSIFEKLGFNQGDVLKKINGEFVSSPDQALELFDRLKSSSEIKIVVEKQGKEKTIEYNVNENAPIQ